MADYDEIQATMKAFTNFGEPAPYGHHPQIEITAYGINTQNPLVKPVLILASCRVIQGLSAETTPEAATTAARVYLNANYQEQFEGYISKYAE